MAQQISDLVINTDVDSATFTEQIAGLRGNCPVWRMSRKSADAHAQCGRGANHRA